MSLIHPVEQLVTDSGYEDGSGNARQVLKHEEGLDAVDSHAADYLALSDYEVDNTTDGGDENEYEEEFYCDEDGDEESEEDEEDDHTEVSEDSFWPLTPWPRSILGELGMWDPELEKLLNEPRSEAVDGLSDMEEFATPKEDDASSPADLPAWTDKSLLWNLSKKRLTLIDTIENDCALQKPVTQKKRPFNMIYEYGSEATGHLRSKRLRI